MSRNPEIPATELPFNFRGVENQYGSLRDGEMICPGVYYVTTAPCIASPYSCGEYIVVIEGSPAIPFRALAYGTALSTTPKLWLYHVGDYFDKGQHVVVYEAHRYLVEHGLPLPDSYSLPDDKATGMEVCPEYFGEYPVPTDTPWGRPIRHNRLWNGLCWLKTKQAGWVLAVGYSLCSDLPDNVTASGMLTEDDRKRGINNTCGYRFYTYESSCIPIFWLLDYAKDTWAQKTNRAALENAILAFFPRYADAYNNLQPSETYRIKPTPDVGTDFYPFP